jgi:hypothetical protein
MKPLLFADWQAINRRFCLALWLVAAALMTVILLHFMRGTPTCVGRPTAGGAAACTAPGKQVRMTPVRPVFAYAAPGNVGGQ